jgi:hypothetical protein
MRICLVFLSILIFAGCYSVDSASTYSPRNTITPNAYGPGIHMNQYGQPVQLKPDFGGVYGEQLRITPNAYGLGVHMDQYGRPVREVPWP